MIEKDLLTYFRKKVLTWSKDNPSNYPWRITNNLWHAMVAEVMLQRTKAEQVLPVYNDFVKRFPSPVAFQQHMSYYDENIFEKLGLKWRDKVFKENVNSIVAEGIPEYKIKLKELPGVGEYVSSALLAFHLNQREVLIDSNIVRLYGRFFGIVTNKETRRNKRFIELAEEITPYNKVKEFNYAILDFSMNICRPRQICKACLLRRKCAYLQKLRIN